MKISARLILSFGVVIGLSACNLPVQFIPAGTGKEVARQYQTISVLLTKTAQPVAVPSQSQTMPVSTPSLIAQAPTPSPVGEISPTVALAVQGSKTPESTAPVQPCNLAYPGRPIDVTVPDDSQFRPGEYFSKTWRLVNAGACSWTTKYSVVWFSGDDLGLSHAQPFNAEIAPGKSVDVTMDMIAPQSPGTYQSNWKLRNNQGEFFGIGPNGDAPFWVRIVVIPVATPTVTPTFTTPTATGTPVVFLKETATLILGDGFDLDQGKANQGDKDDLLFHQPQGGKIQLSPVNGARMVPFGASVPRFEECQVAVVVDSPIEIDQYLPGTYFCYRTNNGLPGWFLLSPDSSKPSQLALEFLTWSLP